MKRLYLFACWVYCLCRHSSACFADCIAEINGGATGMPILLHCQTDKIRNQNLGTNITRQCHVDVGSDEIFNYPFIHMTGHGNVMFSDQEVQNLRTYLISGGFLHIDDNYGLDQYIRPQMKKVFPELDFVELPANHPIYHQKFNFPNGLPKIHEHDGKPAQGFGLIWKGRLVCFYTYECDLGDGWEDPAVHHDSQTTRLKALQMGANLVQYVFGQ